MLVLQAVADLDDQVEGERVVEALSDQPGG